MGRQSRGLQARLKNFEKPPTVQKSTVEDVTDSEDEDYVPRQQNGLEDLLEEGFFFLDQQIHPIYQCILTGFDRPGSSLGKPEISRPSCSPTKDSRRFEEGV